MNKLHPILTHPLLHAGLVAGLLALLPACGDKASNNAQCTDCGSETGQLRLTDPNARACEALIEATGGRVASVEFGSGAAGKAVIEGDRAGVSVISEGAAALPEAAGTVRFDGELKLVSSTCFDANGAALPGAGLTL